MRLAGVAKEYTGRRRGTVRAIGGVDLDVRPGEFVSLVGPSGCGKSTLLYIIGGFVAASGGTVDCDGRPVTAPGPDRGIVFQEFALFPWRTVAGNVAWALARRGVPRAERPAATARLLETVGLAEVARLYPAELSGGMKQRVAIARTLAQDPDVLLMDEPFGALDAQTRALLQEELLAVWERTGKTVVFVTHSVEEALYLSDRVVVLSRRPARVLEVIEPGFARPRDREKVLADPAYPALHARVWELLRAGGAA
ncbi:ABC transporter ATP-binding protein [Actinomadura sp. PM05-2]|uniref:ABC transporter ATP-binding protein n=1 Tax=Actinomadura parmotrematis TaxID=2864039 RepID=A0ABS7FZJ6_9ACTN|nr:ABC transporter ATP-binding protein [Actinomadura parmotrematis]